MKTMKCLLAALCAVIAISCSTTPQALKPRLVVMTDIGPAEVEPDDNESAVRLLSYADRFEIEAICTTIGWNCDPYPAEWQEYLIRVVDGYETDVHNLMKRSEQTGFKSIEEENGSQELGYWPSPEYIRSRVMYGSERAGIGVIGEGNDSAGSDFLIELALEDDPRPIWVTSWGGSNTLAQAIWRYSQTATPEQLKAFVNKFRIYTITDQDMQYNMRMNRSYSSHQWMREQFKDDLKFIWDESAWYNQNDLGKANWDKYAEFIQNHGEMGKVYPHYLWGVEGDTPSFLYVMPNGLNDPEDPTQVSWGGYHTYNISPDRKTYAWTNWQKPVKGISDAYEKKFYPDEFNDFAARMAWANDGEGNTNPIVVVNGEKGIAQIALKAKTGKKVKLDASATKDAEGDALTFNWWIQPEAGSYEGEMPEINGKDSAKASVTIPEDAAGKTLHIICEVHDDGAFNLVSYRRVVITVE
ncbi:MAG: DUF1593 domain-containing protein [Bacteroidia bacterium]|nr:DUF1593 domain-containing protein [Bacteroidia bacterium]